MPDRSRALPRRGPRPSARGARAALLVVLVALAAACGPSTVPLADLAADQEAYHGEEIVVRGTVVEFGGDDSDIRHHAVMQDSDANRVELVPLAEAEPHFGSIVEVSGEFEFDPNRGRMLHIDSIEPLGD